MPKEKDTFYFSHDYDPLGDPKIQAMIGDYGAIGYGIFWRMVEMLHADSKHKLPFKRYIYSAIAKQMSTNVQQKSTKGLHVEVNAEQVEAFVKDCINEYELFTSDDDFFWSNRALRNIEHKDGISEKRSQAGKKSAEKRKKPTNVQQVSTNVQQKQASAEQNPTKEIKGNKKKEEEIKLNENSRCYAKVSQLEAAAAEKMKIFRPDMNEKILAAQSHELATKYVNKVIENLQSLCNDWIKRYENERINNPANRLTSAKIAEHAETPL